GTGIHAGRGVTVRISRVIGYRTPRLTNRSTCLTATVFHAAATRWIKPITTDIRALQTGTKTHFGKAIRTWTRYRNGSRSILGKELRSTRSAFAGGRRGP